MTLKVIRYKNYGCQMTSEDNKDKFYFSFYELSNGKIIELMLFLADNEGVIIDQYEFSYTKIKLKTGEIREYKFGNAKPNTRGLSNEFFNWFDANPPVKQCKELIWPTKDEKKCVKEFFNKNILKTKEVATNIVNV